jgi:4-alpha-glucanotransferase
MQERPSLARLASLCGITSGYHDISGAWHPTSDETAERLLAAMGIAASTEEEAARSVAEREAAAGPRLEAGVAHEIAYPAPPACAPLNDRIGEDRAWGVYANLYTVRARSRFGIGDFGALAKLADWVAEAGGDFVAVNPLHTLAIESGSGCPYAPASGPAHPERRRRAEPCPCRCPGECRAGGGGHRLRRLLARGARAVVGSVSPRARGRSRRRRAPGRLSCG